MSNRLVVESDDDRVFIEAVIRHINSQSMFFEPPICAINDYECMAGLDQGKLRMALQTLKDKLVKEDIHRIGIVLDHDGRPVERLSQITEAIHSRFAQIER